MRPGWRRSTGPACACGVEPAALRSALDAVAADALADFCTASNPRPAGPEDVKALLRELA